jgi:hypothetical protein
MRNIGSCEITNISLAICYSCIAPLVLIFAAIGLFLFYFAYRYNILYVYDIGADTKGAVYPRALQQLFVGLYIAEVCLLGLFAVRLNSKGAIGPFVMMILLLIFTALYNVALNAALTPLINFLPKTLDAEEQRSLLEDHNTSKHVSQNGSDETKGNDSTLHQVDSPAPHPKPNFITKFLKPHIYNDYATMRRLVPTMLGTDGDMGEEYLEMMTRDAYLPPAVWAEVPQLVIPRDEMGISVQEVRDTRKVIPITDEGATLNEKNKIIVNDDVMSAIYFEDKALQMKMH